MKISLQEKQRNLMVVMRDIIHWLTEEDVKKIADVLDEILQDMIIRTGVDE